MLICLVIAKALMLDLPKDPSPSSGFPTAEQQLCNHLDIVNQQDHLLNPVEELIDKLPAGFKLDWVRFKNNENQASIRTFDDLM